MTNRTSILTLLCYYFDLSRRIWQAWKKLITTAQITVIKSVLGVLVFYFSKCVIFLLLKYALNQLSYCQNIIMNNLN